MSNRDSTNTPLYITALYIIAAIALYIAVNIAFINAISLPYAYFSVVTGECERVETVERKIVENGCENLPKKYTQIWTP